MFDTHSEMTGLEKASVLLMSLGTEASEEILKRLSREERDLLDAQILRMRQVKTADRDRILGEVGEAIKQTRSSDSQPFRWLEQMDSDCVADLIKAERPQTIALVLSYLTPGLAGSVLARLDQRVRNGAAEALLQKSRVSDEVVKTIEDTLRKRLLTPFGGSTREAAPILKSLGKATARARESVRAAISKPHSPDSSELASLEDLAVLPDIQVRVLLGEADVDDLCLALGVASDDLREAVMRNVPGATAGLLRQRLASTAQVKIREIEMAQKRVLGAMCRAMRVEAVVAGEGSVE